MRVRRAGAIALSIATVGMSAAQARAADPGEQIAALQKIKRSLSPVERKLDSKLAVDLRTKKVATVDVDIRVRQAGADLVPRLRKLGANVRYVSPRSGAVRAAVPSSAIRTIATWGDVERVDPAAQATTMRMGGKPTTKEERGANAEAVRRAAAAVVSEGVAAHGVDTVFERDKVTGTGVKVCVLSDGVDSLGASQASGELPADVDVLAGEEGDGDEGTAMLEIVHDMAPGATLGFATAFTSDASFADNIRALRFGAGCDVIADDVVYYNESPFQDGPIAQSVNAVTADGALYFSSAGNEGNTLDGTSANYENDFRGAGRSVGKFAGEAHDFDPGPAVQVFEPISDDSSASVVTTLHWADPLGAAADDYDMYLFDATGTVVNFSQDVQDGDDDPYEVLGTPLFGGSGLRLAVVRFSGAPRYFQLSAFGGRYSDAPGLPAWVTPGVTRGHSAAKQARFSMAAAPAAEPLPFDLEPGDPPNPSGPYPGVFTAAQLPERFTSDGPRRMFFDASGAPAPQTRAKPDFTAADGVSTSVPDFEEFFGTSAAAPSAAGIAALVRSGNPTATVADVREAFAATALDLAPAGPDTRSGGGILRADDVLAYTGATPQPLVEAEQPTIVTSTDGDRFLEPGETATLRVPVTNVGDGTATGISAVVTTPDADLTITPRTRAYGDLPAGATVSRDFTVTLAASHQLGKAVTIAVRLTFAGALSPTQAGFKVGVGQPGTTPVKFSYTGPAVAIPDASTLGASIPIAVTGVGYASGITFSVDGTQCSEDPASTSVGINHSYVGDLTGTLTSPAGKTAVLFQRRGGTGENLCQVVFDDAAARPFASVAAADDPFTGTWRPQDPLATLAEAAVDGTWTFKVTDGAASDTGSVRAFTLSLTGFVQ